MDSLSACRECLLWIGALYNMLQPVCGRLLLVLLLVRQPAAEKSKVMTYKMMKWNRVLKTMRSIHCSHYLYFSCCIFWSLNVFSTHFPFFPLFPFSAIDPIPVLAHFSTNQHLTNTERHPCQEQWSWPENPFSYAVRGEINMPVFDKTALNVLHIKLKEALFPCTKYPKKNCALVVVSQILVFS